MKTAARVMLIIGMVFGGILIFPIVIGVMTLIKLDEVKKKDDLFVWAILSLILVNVVAGILMLCMKDEDLQDDQSNNSANPESKSNSQNENNITSKIEIKEEKQETKSFDSTVEKLEKIHELKEKKIISEQEYEELKNKLIKEL